MIHYFPSYRTLLLVLCMFTWLVGCASGLDQVNLEPQGAGFRSTLPKAGTRVVVWGNHASAVDKASMWLYRQGLTIIDRTRLQQGLNERETRLTGSSKNWGHILKAGSKVGADLVTFVEVSNIKGGQKFSLSQVRAAPAFSLTVEVRGVKPATGEIVTKSKAWQTAPTQDPDTLITELTMRALDWAWQPITSGLQVTAVGKRDGSQEADVMSSSSASLATQDSPPEQGLVVNGFSHSVSQHDLSPKTHKEVNQESSVPMNSTNSAIAAKNASGTRELDVMDPLQPSWPSHYEDNQESAIRSSLNSEPIPLTSTTMDNKAILPGEVDSTFLHDLDPIPETKSSPQSSNDLGVQVASGVLSVLYTPAKIVYASLGGIFGGLAYVLSGGDKEAADTIWTASLEGDYYLTPDHINGDTPVQFMGHLPDKTSIDAQETRDPFVAQSSTSSR